MKTTEICACTHCGEMCSTSQYLADLKVHDSEGYLDYILIAHISCIPPEELYLWEYDDKSSDDEPFQSLNNYMDDGEALASAGMGTDEDYGYYGGEF